MQLPGVRSGFKTVVPLGTLKKAFRLVIMIIETLSGFKDRLRVCKFEKDIIYLCSGVVMGLQCASEEAQLLASCRLSGKAKKRT